MFHFALDKMENIDRILQGLETFGPNNRIDTNHCKVYILTNYGTSFDDDLFRIKSVMRLGFIPIVRIYRKESLPHPHFLRHLQRWANNPFIFKSCKFSEYIPSSDGRTIRQIYGDWVVKYDK